MPRRPIGDAPLTVAQRSAKLRAKAKAQREAYARAAAFVASLEPQDAYSMPHQKKQALRDIQREIVLLNHNTAGQQ